MKDEEYVMYIVVREDLGMSVGKVAAQVGHAVQKVMEDEREDVPLQDLTASSRHFRIREWRKGSSTKIIKGADAKEFEKVKDLQDTYLIVDEGRTEIEPNTETVIAVCPMHRKNTPGILKRLRLLS